MHGSGTTNPSKMHWDMMSLFQSRLKTPTHLTYRAVGSSTGRAEFIAGVNDFGCSEVPMSQSEMDEVGEDVLHFPFVIGAIGVFHNVPDSSDVQLSGDVLSKIFSGQITTWNHAEIVATNPDLEDSSEDIVVVHRTYGSSSTSVLSQYLDEFSSWTLGTGSTLNWPSETVAVEGSGGMSDYIEANPWTIGYMDAGHGHDLGIAEVSIANANGIYLTSKEADIAAAAENVVLPASDGDWSGINLVNLPGDDTWPMTAWSYMLVRKDLSSISTR